MKSQRFNPRSPHDERELAAQCAAHQAKLGHKLSVLGLGSRDLQHLVEHGLRNRPIGLPYSAAGSLLRRSGVNIGHVRPKESQMNAAVQHLRRHPAASKAPPNSPRAIFQKWLRGGDGALSVQDWDSVRNTMSTTTPAEGGYTVPTEVAQSVIEALKAFGGMREAATVIQTDGGNPINWPTSDGTAEVGEIVAENTAATALDITFGVKTLNVFKYSSKVVAVPFELLQDSAVDIEGLVRGRLAQRLGRISNTHYTNGSGSGQPTGLVTAATVGVTASTGGTVTVTYSNLVDLIHSVDPAYRIGGVCRFMMNDNSLKAVQKLLDTNNRPIWSESYDAGILGGVPLRLLGYPITINQDMPSMAANAKSIAFGDFSQYVIRDVLQVAMFRFADSPYIKLGQIGFLAWMRSGGNLTDSNAVKLFQNSAS